MVPSVTGTAHPAQADYIGVPAGNDTFWWPKRVAILGYGVGPKVLCGPTVPRFN